MFVCMYVGVFFYSRCNFLCMYVFVYMYVCTNFKVDVHSFMYVCMFDVCMYVCMYRVYA